MSDDVTNDPDVDRLIVEIEQLRGKVAQLQERVQQLDQLAHQDSLIQLPNRRGFMRELERLIDRISRYGNSAAMLFVDLDGLKMINDSFGHRAGDEALIQVADLLSKGVRRSDVVARLGGDEFGIVLEDLENDAEAKRVAARVIELMHTPIDLGHAAVTVGVSIGIAYIAGRAITVAGALAEAALYRAKRSGGGRFSGG